LATLLTTHIHSLTYLHSPSLAFSLPLSSLVFHKPQSTFRIAIHIHTHTHNAGQM